SRHKKQTDVQKPPFVRRAERMRAMLRRLGLVLALVSSFVFTNTPALAQSDCQLTGGFALLQSQIPDRVGTCTGAEIDRIELGEATQPTSSGQLVYHAVDGVVSFSDGAHTWVLDPTGQVQLRGVNERFPWEFNGDGFPLV